MLMATFLHEQIHQLEPEHPTEFEAAMNEVKIAFPQIDSAIQDLKERRAAYRHYIVCYFEIEALKKLLGEMSGLGVISRKRNNVDIYQDLLIPTNAATVRSICRRHRLNPEYR